MDQFSSAIVLGAGNLSSALALLVGATVVKIIIGSRDAERAETSIYNTRMPKLPAGEMVGTASQQAVKGADLIVGSVRGHDARMVSDPRG